MNDILTIVEHQEIFVSSKRDVEKNTISYEDRELLFDIVHYDRQNKKKYVVSPFGRNKIKANSIVGSISLKTGLTIEILPKFSKQNLDTESLKKHRKMLLNMLRVSKEKNFISSSSKSSKISANEMPLLHYIVELFSSELLFIIRSGAFRTYNQKIENSSHIKGKVLISKTINNNSIDRSKVFIAYNKYSSNNLLMQIFRTLAKILLDDTNLSYATKQTLHEIYSLLDGINIIALKPQDFKSITFNRLNDKFEILFRQAEFIFNRYMPFTSHINSTPFWSILFNMDYLFEKFCAYLFRKSDLEIEEHNITKCFENHKYEVSAKPDFVIKGNKNLFEKEIISVVDAKWKLLTNDKSLYGLNAQNFWQLFSYMNLLNPKEELHGYFIVPKNNEDFDDEIIFTPIKEGNKSITILSIDFSLSFEELIERYRFEIINKTLQIKLLELQKDVEEIIPFNEKIKEEVETIEVKEKFKFNLEEFIEELEILHNNKNIVKQLSPTKKDERFKNLYYLKEISSANSKVFKISIKDNLTRQSWNLQGLEITSIPNNISKLKQLISLDLKNNLLENLPKSLFELKKLVLLDISQNLISIIPYEVKNLKNLKKISIDKEIIEENIVLIAELRKNNVFITDEENNDLSQYINSFIAVDENKNTEIGFNQDEVIEPENIKENIDATIKPITMTPKVTFERTTIDDYQNMDDEEKMHFLESANFNLIDTNLIKFIIKNENNIDRLEDFTYNQTLSFQYLHLTYKHNINRSEDELLKLKDNIDKRLDKSIFIYEKMDEDTLCLYAISENKEFYEIREKISKSTKNLYILNELSKHIDDEPILWNIIFKTQDNDYFKQLVKNKDTIYSLEILARIARYEKYYEFGNDKCLITSLAQNYSLSDKTREYLFEKYQSDLVFLQKLSENKSSWKLQSKIESALYGSYSENTNDEPFHQITIKTKN